MHGVLESMNQGVCDVKFWVRAGAGRGARLAAVAWLSAACTSSGSSIEPDAGVSARRGHAPPSMTTAAIVEQVCRRFERCGEYQVVCPRGRCSYSIRPVRYDDCVRSGRDWSCVIERGADVVKECLGFAVDRPCVTEKELERHVATLNQGQPSFLSDHNQACRDLGELWRQCDADQKSTP